MCALKKEKSNWPGEGATLSYNLRTVRRRLRKAKPATNPPLSAAKPGLSPMRRSAGAALVAFQPTARPLTSHAPLCKRINTRLATLVLFVDVLRFQSRLSYQ